MAMVCVMLASDLKGSFQGVMGGQDGVAGALAASPMTKTWGATFSAVSFSTAWNENPGQNHIVIPTEGTGSAISQGVVHAIGIELADLGAGSQEDMVFFKVREHITTVFRGDVSGNDVLHLDHSSLVAPFCQVFGASQPTMPPPTTRTFCPMAPCLPAYLER